MNDAMNPASWVDEGLRHAEDLVANNPYSAPPITEEISGDPGPVVGGANINDASIAGEAAGENPLPHETQMSNKTLWIALAAVGALILLNK